LYQGNFELVILLWGVCFTGKNTPRSEFDITGAMFRAITTTHSVRSKYLFKYDEFSLEVFENYGP
jgi:hypothetical protein